MSLLSYLRDDSDGIPTVELYVNLFLKLEKQRQRRKNIIPDNPCINRESEYHSCQH